MKHIVSSAAVGVLFLAAALSGSFSYRNAEHRIVNDLNQALSATIAQTEDDAITPETAELFRRNLTLDVLKDTTYIAYCMPGGKSNGICSREMKMNKSAVRGYADIKFASVFGITDKRAPAAFSLLALLWLTGILSSSRKEKDGRFAFVGNVAFDAGNGIFYSGKTPMQLTPMQRDLMKLFFNAEGHMLSQQEICNRLWPKKPDPDETLYSLVRHLKSRLEDSSDLEIETLRGYGYRLRKR